MNSLTLKYCRLPCPLQPVTCARAGFTLLVVILVQCGCGTVRPQEDYAHASALIRQRVGAETVYDPQSDSLVEARVQELLKDGVSVDEAVTLANRSAF
jgi:hypothetical protein